MLVKTRAYERQYFMATTGKNVANQSFNKQACQIRYYMFSESTTVFDWWIEADTRFVFVAVLWLRSVLTAVSANGIKRQLYGAFNHEPNDPPEPQPPRLLRV